MKESITYRLQSIKCIFQVLLFAIMLAACNSENNTQETSTTDQVAGNKASATADSAEFTGPANTVNNNLEIPGDGKACNILSQQEVKQALGITNESFRNADTTVNRYGNACTYYWQKAGSGFMNIASVYIPQANSAIATETAFREDLGSKGKNSQKITNLGDEAYWLNEINQLYVIKNGRWFYVSMVVGNDQDRKQTQERARALAEKIVAKL